MVRENSTENPQPALSFTSSLFVRYGPSHSPDGAVQNTRFAAFYDIAGITEDPVAFRKVVELFVRRYKAATDAGYGPTKIAGFEPRGFIFGTAVAVQLGIPFVMIGKAGRLPGVLASSGQHDSRNTDNEAIMRLGSVTKGDRVVVVDDLIATGGTAVAGIGLVDSLGAEVYEFAAVMAPGALGGVARMHTAENGRFAAVPVFTLLEDDTVQSLRDHKMDYTPPEGTPRKLTPEQAKNFSFKIPGGGGDVPSWP